MNPETTKKCAACEGEDGLFRPVQKGKSGRYLWACSTECADQLAVVLLTQFTECGECHGEGGWPCGNPFCPVEHHECEECDGEGVIETEYETPAAEALH